MKTLAQRLLLAGGMTFIAMTLLNCQSRPIKQSAVVTPQEDTQDLSREEAQSRKARVSNVRYQLAIKLIDRGATYSGKSQIAFELNDNSAPLSIDFFEGKVQSLSVNGQALPLNAKKKYRLELPPAVLRRGTNTIDVTYTQEYSHQGQGLDQFLDPETKETFLYTQFETYDANRFMPCFDQPDLRATLTLTVEAPEKWQVISTTRETSITALPGRRRLWVFPVTPPIATYLFSLHAGPFKVWTDQYEDIPLRLFVRPSMAKYVHPDDWFRWTKNGLKFYNNYFAFKYPFKKYDQVIAPDFADGAMENVAAVTFSEEYLSRAKTTRSQRRTLSEVLLHEMAHMWFGDVVTMGWWNNLWLNESFASFMSALAMQNATEFKESWQHFYVEYKSWAYLEDGLVTTHPIEASVMSVKDAFADFDGITYGKGASALKQLWAYITPEQFQKGIRTYIHTFAYRNADLKEFIDILQTETGRDLTTWANRWLRQSGTDRLSAKWSCVGGALQKIELTSKPKISASFRPQSIQVALFQDKKPTVVRVALTQATQTISGNWPCPNFVYPNFQDDAYTQVDLDPVSLNYVKQNMNSISDVLLRTQVWGNLWEMVRETRMPLGDYIKVVNASFSKEENETVLEQIVSTVSGLKSERGTVLYYWPQNTRQDKTQRMEYILNLEMQYLKRLQKAKAGSDQQKFWFDSFVSLAQTPKALGQLSRWANDPKVALGLSLDLDRKWALVRQLSRYRHPRATGLAAHLKKADLSERGEKGALASDAIQPKLSVKRKWVEIVKQSKPTLSLADAKTVLTSLFPIEQMELTKRFENDFYAYLKENGDSDNDAFVQTVVQTMAPLDCGGKESARMKEFIEANHGFAPIVAKELKINLQEDERCQRLRAAR